MKKILLILSLVFIAASWLAGCTMKGSRDYVADYIYGTTPSPTVTVTATPTP